MRALGILTGIGTLGIPDLRTFDRALPQVRPVSAPRVLNEAPAYGAAFSRGVEVELTGASLVLLSGTASVDAQGHTVHAGDFGAQCWRTFRNLTELLWAAGLTWHHVVRTTCYLRDIERDYAAFNAARTSFYNWLGLQPLPASTGIQAILCRPDLLLEIEAMAVTVLHGQATR